LSKPSRRATRNAGSPSGPAGGQTGSPAPSRAASTRAGRRERARIGYARKSFFERYRGAILTVAILAGIGLIGAVLVTTATAKTYTCTQIWEPSPTPEPSAGQSPRLGYVQRDMGASHDPPVPTQYTLCPPASGRHFGSPSAPIQARLYGRDDFAPPQGWLHNLEHGAIVVLYRGGEASEAATEDGQARLRDLYQNFPASPICGFERGNNNAGVVIARFDDMAWPYAALVWDRVLPLETLDADLVYAFWRTEGERTNPETFCPRPTPTPGPSESAVPSGSVAPSDSTAPSPAPSS
jgi:hypothetical protein